MQFYSTNHHSPKVSLKDAVVRSEAPDGGLYMPEKLPLLPKAFVNNIAYMSASDMAFVISNMMFADYLPSNVIKRMAEASFSFQMPLHEIEPGIFVYELFHGPTMTVKDIGARFLGTMLQNLHCLQTTPLNVLMATNGNSGVAISNVFHNIPGVNVFALYPKGLQRSLVDKLNSYGGNIHTIEVMGHLENCQSMIHRAFLDPELSDYAFTSANSFNLGSLMPYTVAYFNAIAQLHKKKGPSSNVYISVPTGSCGNLLAAYMAKHMGMPVDGLIAACNVNAGFKKCLDRGIECVRDMSTRSLAYSMDMPRSANLPRFMELCEGDIHRLRSDISADVATDKEIAHAINDVYSRTKYLLDPHSAVSYICLKKQLPKGATGIFVATAHPSLSASVLSQIDQGGLLIPESPNIPATPTRADQRIAPTYAALKKLIKFRAVPKPMEDRV